VVESLAGQLGIADASVLKLYAQRGQTCSGDLCRLQVCGLRRSGQARGTEVVPVGPGVDVGGGAGARKILLPGVSTLTHLVSEVHASANERLYSALIDAAGPP
jgi:hypothetical protein